MTVKKILAAAVAVIVIGGTSGIGGAALYNNLYKSGDSSLSLTFAEGEENDSAPAKTENNPVNNSIVLMENNADIENSLSIMFERVSPSVAFITSKSEGQTSGGGTGIVMSPDGYLVTNAHVIQTEKTVYDDSQANDSYNPFGAFGFQFGFGGFGGSYRTEVVNCDDITVTIRNEDNETKDYKAKIIGVDTTTDLAVIKIEATGLSPAVIGDSSKLKIGENCYTLGYPLGIGLSASDGIVSGLDRDIGIEMANGKNQSISLIQTTAAINPGNSGGPLLDAAGSVIGITSAKLVSSSVEGFGFAIPITTAMPIISELMTNGSYKSDVPVIGISGSNLNATAARYYGLPVTEGVLIESVEDGSGAEAAGLVPGDIIVKADGEDVKTMDELTEIKNTHKAGETMTLTLARESGNVDITVTL
ncbi:MAG: trypsin-like peptidase domain-containing protein [Ruminococcus sp.]|jgi:serine protease Do|nr:trypsin-like peptidase domain-containing protein [Ruminococcus sp.]